MYQITNKSCAGSDRRACRRRCPSIKSLPLPHGPAQAKKGARCFPQHRQHRATHGPKHAHRWLESPALAPALLRCAPRSPWGARWKRTVRRWRTPAEPYGPAPRRCRSAPPPTREARCVLQPAPRAPRPNFDVIVPYRSQFGQSHVIIFFFYAYMLIFQAGSTRTAPPALCKA